MISFIVAGVPVAKARARAGRHGFYTPAKTKEAEKRVAKEARRMMAGKEPTGAPLSIDLEFYFEPPKSWSKAKRSDAIARRTHKTSKPDVDNLAKLVKDALNGIVWVDDAQVISAYLTKRYDAIACTVIKVKEVGQT